MPKNIFCNAELNFLIALINDYKNRLFGMGGVASTSSNRKALWETISRKLSENGGWPKRSDEELKKKWSNLVQIMKSKLDKKNRSGEGGVNWTEIDEQVQTVLGRKNPKLISISGGFDSGTANNSSTTCNVDCAETDSHDSHTEDLLPVSATTSTSQLPVKPQGTPSSRKRPRKTHSIPNNLDNQLKEEHEWARERHVKKWNYWIRKLYTIAVCSIKGCVILVIM